MPELVGLIAEHIESLKSSSVTEFLLIVWNFIREKFPYKEPLVIKDKQDPYIRSLKMLIHKNIAKLGRLYAELQRGDGKLITGKVNS